MTNDPDPLSESAKATQEVAKTVSKGFEASRDLGGFIAKFVTGSLEQGMGIVEDKLKYLRWERQQRLMQRAEEFMKEIGIDGPCRPIPLKFAVPLFEGASMEDDDYLQDLWAKLLVNASAPGCRVELRRAHIDVLERLSPLEARILEVMYAYTAEELSGNGLLTDRLPARAVIAGENEGDGIPPPSPEISLALANLSRLGCLSLPSAWNLGEIFTVVYPTLFGRSVVEACTLAPSG